MKSIFSIGSKQTDLEIFKYVDDKDIVNVCLINKAANGLLSEEKYWLQRFFHFYKKYLEGVNYKAYKGNKSWKEYYIDITRRLKTPFPHYESALALAERRFEFITLLENFHNIKRVKAIMARDGDLVECYYTRDGKNKGIKEGAYFQITLPEGENKSKLNYMIVSKIPNRIEEHYKADIKQFFREFENGILTHEKLYESNELVKETKCNKNGLRIYEEIRKGETSIIREWFINGNIKSESCYKRGKKHGISYRWKKSGEKSVKYYDKGKIVPSPEERKAQRLAEKAYADEIKRQADLEKKRGHIVL